MVPEQMGHNDAAEALGRHAEPCQVLLHVPVGEHGHGLMKARVGLVVEIGTAVHEIGAVQFAVSQEKGDKGNVHALHFVRGIAAIKHALADAVWVAVCRGVICHMLSLLLSGSLFPVGESLLCVRAGSQAKPG